MIIYDYTFRYTEEVSKLITIVLMLEGGKGDTMSFHSGLFVQGP